MSGAAHTGAGGQQTLGDLGEAGILGDIFATLTTTDAVLVGPGDDTALLATSGPVLATTDTMVRGRDWLDEWSSAHDVGAKVVVQNLADLAAMGGVGTGLLVTLVAPGSLPAQWARELTAGIAEVSAATGVPVIGGDLSSSDGAVVVSVTALGALPGGAPVLRSGAAPGQEVAVSGSLGRSAAGLEILRRGDVGWWPSTEHAGTAAGWVAYHCRPDPDLTQGPRAAEGGATAMLDVSDGLVRDGGRIAAASGVRLELDEQVVARLAAAYEPVLGGRMALECVLAGGEEHSLLATFPAGAVPDGWTVVGRTVAAGTAGPGVWWRGERATGGGWDHFGG
ncbi:thiamine-phosphate kinase [Ornithinimicrobium sp. F0845]|uniref:thiamine-phosphate kinase n=1 Tax=Ornithinimicrobium sp. F0845 TaxID=2926412 RepID=UPI001FF547AB|nr:thiamine-phosphate kinase [Ornithinimicrobium sp. F0845]MCK0111321.1 thiamine-phosphate kinase [Ornithinimicrobium sp. F0845]